MKHWFPGECRQRTPKEMLTTAECALSPRVAEEAARDLFKIAPNPFEHGRINQKAMWLRSWTERSRNLIWC
jgi:hypothetical protein